MAANSVFIFPGGLGGGGISPVSPSLFPNGSAAAPSISFINDPQSGRYLIGVDNVGESINGSLVFDWNATRLRTSLPIYLPDGAVGTPALAFENDISSGLYRLGNDNLGHAINGNLIYDWNASRIQNAVPLLFPDGVVGTPALSFTNDPTSGRYRIGDDNFGESVNGVLAFDWNTTRLLFASGYLLSFSGNNSITNSGNNFIFSAATSGSFGFTRTGVATDRFVIDIDAAGKIAYLGPILGNGWTTHLIGGNAGENLLTLTRTAVSLPLNQSFAAGSYKVGAVSGVDFGPGAVTSITVTKGIVTAIS